MYATKNGESRPVTRHQTKEDRKQTVGVLWCPWCDTSNQDDRGQCGGCEAVFSNDWDFTPAIGTDSGGWETGLYDMSPHETIHVDYDSATGVLYNAVIVQETTASPTLETEPAADPEPTACQCGHALDHHSDAKGCSYRRFCKCKGFEHLGAGS